MTAPPGWTEVALGELMPKRRGTIDPRKFSDEEFNLLSIPAFDAGRPERVLGSAVGSTKQLVEPGDVLLSKIVPHIRRAWIVPPETRRSIGSSEWIIFRDRRADPGYLRHLLVSDRFHRSFMKTVAGVGGSLLRARPAHVANIHVPLPPLEEQRRIAAILDKADELRAKRRAALEQLGTLTQAIFVDMFTRNRDPAWPVRALGEMADVQGGLQVSRRRSTLPLEAPYLRVANVHRGRLDLSEVKTMRVTEAELQRTVLEPGDLLVVEGHGNADEIGRVGRWSGAIEGCVHQNHLIRVRADGCMAESAYLEVALNTGEPLRQLRGAGRTTSGLNTLSTSDVRAVSVLVPPLDVQQEFVRQREALRGLGERQAEAAARLDALSAALQSRAFRGEL